MEAPENSYQLLTLQKIPKCNVLRKEFSRMICKTKTRMAPFDEIDLIIKKIGPHNDIIALLHKEMAKSLLLKCTCPNGDQNRILIQSDCQAKI